jgi:CII-binding regulator of phage lambda lysogenization HflD
VSRITAAALQYFPPFGRVTYLWRRVYTRMLEQRQKLRRERKTFRDLNAKIFSFWNDYSNSVISTEELLEKCAEIYTNFNASKFVKTVDDFRLFELETE